jgi:hypothetical protein
MDQWLTCAHPALVLELGYCSRRGGVHLGFQGRVAFAHGEYHVTDPITSLNVYSTFTDTVHKFELCTIELRVFPSELVAFKA